MNWSPDTIVYLAMAVIGAFTWYIGFSNESSKSGKVVITSGLSLFVALFVILFFVKLLNKI